jgi:hypothetical protein
MEISKIQRAGDEIRTHEWYLGKVLPYHLATPATVDGLYECHPRLSRTSFRSFILPALRASVSGPIKLGYPDDSQPLYANK